MPQLHWKLWHGWVITSHRQLRNVITYPCSISKRGPRLPDGLAPPNGDLLSPNNGLYMCHGIRRIHRFIQFAQTEYSNTRYAIIICYYKHNIHDSVVWNANQCVCAKETAPGYRFNIKTIFPGIGILIIKIGYSWDRLNFISWEFLHW